jgi:farnesyl diphosphate synthase
MIDSLARAAGSKGMVGGQSLDLESEGKPIDLVQLENIHIHKTGALIRAAVNMGALSRSDLDPVRAEALDHYAKCIGLAFQIQDDLLDVEGDTAVIGKQSGADAAHDKATYPALMGIGPAREAANDLVADALKSLELFDDGADPLRWIAAYIVNRDR